MLWPEHSIDLKTVVICQWQGLTVAGHLADGKKKKQDLICLIDVWWLCGSISRCKKE